MLPRREELSGGSDVEGRIVGMEGRIQLLGGDVGDVLSRTAVGIDLRLAGVAEDGERGEPRSTTDKLASMIAFVVLLFTTSASATMAA